MIDFLKSLLFARKCVLCGEILEGGEDAFCPKCQLEFEKLLRTPCKECGKKHRDCRCLPQKLHGKARFGIHLFAYDGELSRGLIYGIKHRDHVPTRRFLAKALASAVRTADIDLSEYAVAFVPRKPRSIREYGFDQAALLAEALAEELNLPLVRLFRHARFSDLQKNLGKKEREENAERSYHLFDDVRTENKKLLIVDDVMTTGSTMARLCDLAQQAGCTEIIAVSVAKTPKT